MIELIKIKLTTGAEIELTMEDARQLFDELQQLFGERQNISIAPFQIQMADLANQPTYTITTGVPACRPPDDV